MKINRSVASVLAITALGVSALAASGGAQAREVYWSVGIGSPGVQVGVSNAPVYLHPAPVLVPRNVYLPPRVVVAPPRVYYSQPQVVYSQPQVVYTQPPYYVQSGWAPPVYYRDRDRGWDSNPGKHGRWDRDHRRGFNDGRRGDR